MIILGVILIVVGALLGLGIITYIGIALAVIGLILTLLGATGHPLWGHKTYY